MLEELQKKIDAAKKMNYQKIEHEGEFIGVGYAKFLVTYYKTKLILEKKK